VKNPAGIKSFATHLRILREKAGMSQQELADAAGISKITIQRIENAKYFEPRKLTAFFWRSPIWRAIQGKMERGQTIHLMVCPLLGRGRDNFRTFL